MKVLGTTNEGFLISCSDDELCNLMGFDGTALAPEKSYDRRIDESSKALKAFKESKGGQYGIGNKVDWVGLSLPVSEIYQSARKVAEGWDKEYGLKEAVKNMRNFADKLEMIKGIYKPLGKKEAE